MTSILPFICITEFQMVGILCFTWQLSNLQCSGRRYCTQSRVTVICSFSAICSLFSKNESKLKAANQVTHSAPSSPPSVKIHCRTASRCCAANALVVFVCVQIERRKQWWQKVVEKPGSLRQIAR